MRLVEAALRAPYTVIVAVLAVVVLGITSLGRMPVDLLPQFQTPAVQIVTFYPGMPAEVMEKDITSRLERWTGQSVGIARQESRSMTGVSIVKDFFHENIDPAAAIAQVSSYAMSDLFYLPPGTVPPMVMPFDPTASLPLALITVSSPKFDETKLYDVAYFDLRNRLQGISGVIAPAVYGGKLRRILAYVDRERLQARGLSPLDVVATLKSFSTLIPTGSAKIGDFDYQILTNGMPERVAEMNDFPVKIDNGMPVYIRDVGEVQDAHQIQTNVVRISAAPEFQSKRQVYIPIYRQPGSNTIQIVDGIRAALGSILARLPEGIKLNVVMDQSVYVRQAIRSLVVESGLGGGLAALMILLFIGNVRSALIITLAIPLSILAAFIGLSFTGNSINAMVLGGLALAVGRLVDDAIVVLENTDRHLALGKPSFQAALDGAAEVAMPVAVATITTIVVFFPVVFLTGVGKFLFTPLALAVSFSIAASYLVAMTVIPVCSARFLQAHAGAGVSNGGVLAAIERSFTRLGQWYAHGLRAAIAHSWLVLAAAGVVFAIALGMMRFVGTELFPEVDAGQLSIRMHAASGTRIERTEDLAARAEAAIKDMVPHDELQMLIANIGVLLDWPAAYTPNAGPQDAFFEVQLTDHRSDTAQGYARRLRQRLAAAVPEAEFSFHTGGLMAAALNFGLPSPIDIQITGNDLHVARGIAEQIRDTIASVPGAVDVRIPQRLDYPAITATVDRVRAANLGLTPKAVVQNIVTSLNSSINFDPAFWIDPGNGNHYFLGAQYREAGITSLSTLENIPITMGRNPVLQPETSRDGVPRPRAGAPDPVLLRNLATFERTTAPTEVTHLNISRVIDVFANVSGRDVGSVAADVERRIEPLRAQWPKGYTVSTRGEVQSMAESFANLGFGFVLAMVLVYLVMVAQFRSFLDPFIIMFAVPLGLIGVVAILLLTGTTMNVQSFMGVIFMVGIAVSNAVLLVEFANRRRAEGHGVDDAIVEAATIRLRPILMTSLAAVIGLLPMAIGLGHGSEANVPLARGGRWIERLHRADALRRPTVVSDLQSRAAGGDCPRRFPVRGERMLRTLPMVALFLLAPLACGGPDASSATRGAAVPLVAVPPAAVRVQVARAERREVTRSIQLPASVEAFEQARLYAKVAGYLGTLDVDIGDRVQRDQLLATLDVPEMQQELAAAEAQVAERRAQLGKAEADAILQKTLFERARALRERNAVTQTDLDEAQAKHAIAQASLQLAAAQVKSAEANLGRLRSLAEYARIKAPFTGIVTERFVDPGALIQSATGSANVTPIVTVARVDRVRTFVDIPEREVPFVSTSNTATLAPSAFSDRTFAGHVTRFAGALNPATRTMRTEVDFENPEGRLYPGMYGSLTLTLEVHAEALTLPSAAVTTQKDGKSFVYVVADDTAHKRPVRLGVDDGVRAEILSGLEGGEQCVVTGSGAIADGAPVQVTDTSTTRAGS